MPFHAQFAGNTLSRRPEFLLFLKAPLRPSRNKRPRKELRSA